MYPGGTPTARDWWAIKKWTVRGGTIFLGDQGPTDSPAQQRVEKCLDLGVDLLYGVSALTAVVDVMGYNISPSLFFIEIFNNDKGNRK